SATARGEKDFSTRPASKTELDDAIQRRVADIAEARGVPMAQVAIAWITSKAVVTAPIIGATKLRHLDDAVAALAIALTAARAASAASPLV
ncbi:MAG TPA: aldo/keto reductase, partial [Anaerolineales bacterium]|nr:aldo/keto reductase [Anaerolineales bacterium]